MPQPYQITRLCQKGARKRLVLDFDDTRTANSTIKFTTTRPKTLANYAPTYVTDFFDPVSSQFSQQWEEFDTLRGICIPNLCQMQLILRILSQSLGVTLFEGSQRILMAFSGPSHQNRYQDMLQALNFFFPGMGFAGNAEAVKAQIEKPKEQQGLFLQRKFIQILAWLKEVRGYLSDPKDNVTMQERLRSEQGRPVSERNLFLINALESIEEVGGAIKGVRQQSIQTVLERYQRYIGDEVNFPSQSEMAFLANVDKGILIAAILDLEFADSDLSSEVLLETMKSFTLFDDGKQYEMAVQSMGANFLLAMPPQFNLMLDNENLLRLMFQYATAEEIVVAIESEPAASLHNQFYFHPVLLRKLYAETYCDKLSNGANFDEYIFSVQEQSPVLALLLQLFRGLDLLNQNKIEAAQNHLVHIRVYLERQNLDPWQINRLIRNLQLNFPFSDDERYYAFYTILALIGEPSLIEAKDWFRLALENDLLGYQAPQATKALAENQYTPEQIKGFARQNVADALAPAKHEPLEKKELIIPFFHYALNHHKSDAHFCHEIMHVNLWRYILANPRNVTHVLKVAEYRVLLGVEKSITFLVIGLQKYWESPWQDYLFLLHYILMGNTNLPLVQEAFKHFAPTAIFTQEELIAFARHIKGSGITSEQKEGLRFLCWGAGFDYDRDIAVALVPPVVRNMRRSPVMAAVDDDFVVAKEHPLQQGVGAAHF